MTYLQLKNLITITGGATPTDKYLRESDIPVVFHVANNNLIIKVYKNGFVSYSIIENGIKHTTVFSLSKVDISYYFVKNTYNSVVTFSEAEFEQLDAEVVLALYGEERLEHNNDARHNISSSKEEKIQKKYVSAIPDFSDDVITRLDGGTPVELILKKLTDKQRQVIYLYFFEEMNQREIAEYLGLTRSAVQSHLNYAKKNLEKMENFKKLY